MPPLVHWIPIAVLLMVRIWLGRSGSRRNGRLGETRFGPGQQAQDVAEASSPILEDAWMQQDAAPSGVRTIRSPGTVGRPQQGDQNRSQREGNTMGYFLLWAVVLVIGALLRFFQEPLENLAVVSIDDESQRWLFPILGAIFRERWFEPPFQWAVIWTGAVAIAW